ARFLGYRDAFLAIFGFFALLGSGQIAESMGWRANFALYLLALPYIAFVLMSWNPPVAIKAKAAANSETRAAVFQLWPIYLMVVVLFIVAYTLYLNLSFLMAGDNLASPAVQSRILATSTVLHFVGSMFYGRLVARIGTRWMLVLILTLMALSDFSIGF